MLSELDVLKLVSERLSNNRFQFMLTGSFALAYYVRAPSLGVTAALEQVLA
jgi:hypothetical protein